MVSMYANVPSYWHHALQEPEEELRTSCEGSWQQGEQAKPPPVPGSDQGCYTIHPLLHRCVTNVSIHCGLYSFVTLVHTHEQKPMQWSYLVLYLDTRALISRDQESNMGVVSGSCRCPVHASRSLATPHSQDCGGNYFLVLSSWSQWVTCAGFVNATAQNHLDKNSMVSWHVRRGGETKGEGVCVHGKDEGRGTDREMLEEEIYTYFNMYMSCTCT